MITYTIVGFVVGYAVGMVVTLALCFRIFTRSNPSDRSGGM